MTGTPYEIYEAVARDRFHRWGYNETLGPEGEERFVREQATEQNLRADTDLVWRLAHDEVTA